MEAELGPAWVICLQLPEAHGRSAQPDSVRRWYVPEKCSHDVVPLPRRGQCPPVVTPAARHRIVSEPRWSELASLLPVVECISNVSYLTRDFNDNFAYMIDYLE